MVDKCHRALLSLSEEFKTKSPPDFKSSLQCLLAITNLPNLEPNIIAKTNFHLGSFIYKHTSDVNVAQTYLLRAYEQTQTADLIPIRLQSVGLLVEIYLAQNQRSAAKELLTRAITDTTINGGGLHNLYWHYRLLLKLSHLNLEDREFSNASYYLSIGLQTAVATNDNFLQILFLLSSSMVYMMWKQQTEPKLVESLTRASRLLETWQDNSAKKEVLKVFFLILQVCNHLNRGENKSAKSSLKTLQQCIQNITNSNEHELTASGETNFISTSMSENFIWMSKDHMCVLVYLISVLHSMQAGLLDKAQRYTEKALLQIDRLQTSRHDPLLDSFQVLLLEHMSMCHLVMGSRTLAIKQVAQATQFFNRFSPRAKVKHRGNIRTILGYYFMSMSMIDDSEIHFKAVMSDNNLSIELRMMSMLNLALCYLQDDAKRSEKRHEVDELLAKIDTDQISSLSYYLKAATYYVYGLKAFCDSNFNDAKRNLRETLKISNGEDLNRITSCALVLLGKIFRNTSNNRAESLDMVTPAMKLATKIPDMHVQLWAASVLIEIYSTHPDSHQAELIETTNIHDGYRYQLNSDRHQALTLPEHDYVTRLNWHQF